MVLIKLKVLQNVILSHVTTLSTNENNGNSQILRDIMKFGKKVRLKSNRVYNSSAKTRVTR